MNSNEFEISSIGSLNKIGYLLKRKGGPIFIRCFLQVEGGTLHFEDLENSVTPMIVRSKIYRT